MTRRQTQLWLAERGWHYEPSDPSVGIFDWGVSHDDDACTQADEWAEVAVVASDDEWLSTWTATCPCGASITFTHP